MAAAILMRNVTDVRRGWIGSWETAPLSYAALSPSDIGRTVIYRDHGRAEAGTLSSFRDGLVFARYSRVTRQLQLTPPISSSAYAL